MAGHSSRGRKLAKEFMDTRLIAGNLRVDLCVGAFEIDVGQKCGAAVSRTSQIDHVGVLIRDESIDVGIDEAEAGRGSPVSKESWFDMRGL